MNIWGQSGVFRGLRNIQIGLTFYSDINESTKILITAPIKIVFSVF